MAFDHIIVYEDRDEIRTTRWIIDGVITKDSGNTDKGWLWFSTVKTGDDLVVTVHKDSAGASSVMLSAATDISDLDNDADNAVKITLAAENTSGLTGTMWVHDWTEDVTLVPVMVSLVMDQDIEDEYARSDEDHMDGVYDSTVGYARFCSVATGHIMRLVSNLYSTELAGYGAHEAYNLTLPERLYPDWRGIVQPLQLLDAAKYYACWKIFMAADESDGTDSMLAYKATQCKEQYDDAVSKWNLAINTDPDTDEDADLSKSASVTRPTRT